MVTGYTHYKDFRAAQHSNFTAVFQKFLDEQKFDIIIEIGTLNGGLTRFIKDASPNSRLISYDVTSQPEHQALIDCGVELKMKNIFGGHYQIEDAEIKEILAQDGKKLILCDGGNKKAEFNSLSEYLRKGDVIMAHDYAVSNEFFNSKIRDIVWNWCELTYDDIKDKCNEFGLIDCNADEFQNIAWACKVKSR